MTLALYRGVIDAKGLYYAMWRQQIGERRSQELQLASTARRNA